jgi:hypothetical protein
MELDNGPRIDVAGAVIHLQLMSLPPAFDLRCGEWLIRSVAWPAGTPSDHQREISMKMTRVLCLAAIGAVLVLAAPAQQAQALSLANPATAAAVQESSKGSTTEVRWHHHYHHHWHHHH